MVGSEEGGEEVSLGEKASLKLSFRVVVLSLIHIFQTEYVVAQIPGHCLYNPGR